MRPTDFCHLNEYRVPVPRVFPAHYAIFTARTPPRSLGSERLTRGRSVSRHSRTLRRIAAERTLPSAPKPHAALRTAWRAPSVGVFFPRRQLTDRTSDTSVASSSFAWIWKPETPREEAAKAALTNPS